MLQAWRRRRARRLTLEQRRDQRLRAAFARERQAGARLAIIARGVALAIVATWLLASQREWSVLYYLAILAAFMALPLPLVALEERGQGRTWHKYVLALFDAALLAAALLLPNPLQHVDYPPAIALRQESILYLYLFLAFTVLSLSPWYVMWTGLVAAAAWSGGVLWIISQPRTKAWIGPHDLAAMSPAERAAIYLDPNFVDVTAWYQEVLLLLVVTGILALAVERSRRLVRRQAAAERERGNLARYFSPNVVDDLASLDHPLDRVRRQSAAVLFADIVGFTAVAEREPPERVIALLREHYGRLGAIVFEHGGTLDKYIGDALMATFGTPEPGLDDATRALRCARAMLASMEAWNRERAAAGEPELRIGIGIDYGPVVLGNIGSERRLEFTVIGDVVNVAARLETLTRSSGVDLVVSGRLVEAVRRETPGAPELAGLAEGPLAAVRGRDGMVPIWMLGEPRAPADEPAALKALGPPSA
jgi:adenylate cyclase